jgi:LPXTG-motif cell wall-anchored protein
VLRLLGLLLVVWLAVSVVGAVIEGLFWLTVIGLLFFAATAALGWSKRREISDRR